MKASEIEFEKPAIKWWEFWLIAIATFLLFASASSASFSPINPLGVIWAVFVAEFLYLAIRVAVRNLASVQGRGKGRKKG